MLQVLEVIDSHFLCLGDALRAGAIGDSMPQLTITMKL